VIDEMSSPVLVVDHHGNILFANQALATMGGWDRDEQIGTNMLGFVAPDFKETIAETFMELTVSEQTFQWAPINTSVIAADGNILPVVVTGAGRLDHPDINGIIYDVRPALEQDILRRGLTKLAHGEPINNILELITDMVTLPPLTLDAAVLELDDDGAVAHVIGATDERFGEILAQAKGPQPWNHAVDGPTRTIVTQFPGGVGEDLFAAGYREFWHVSPEVNDESVRYRIVAGCPVVRNPTVGQEDRMSKANELASVVLLRAQADAMLEHSATHDHLTALPNRAGFQRQAQELLTASEAETAALLFIDLDGFKAVNDAHGHAVGDAVLQTVARRLVSVTRSIDLVARLGGDEFVVLVGATTDRPANRERVRVVADRTLVEVSRAIDVDGLQVRIAASIGAAIATMPADLEELLLQSDSAMYEAKRDGGNRHQIIQLAAPAEATPQNV